MNRSDAIKLISVKKGDITAESTDAIVNAANTSLLGGGGVDGAIHRAAGPGLLTECRTLGGCRSGEARITGGYNLPAKYVIHTPGPIYTDGSHGEPDVLKNSYNNSLILAKRENLESIAFPAISTGVYRYPKDEAVKIAVETSIDFMTRENYEIKVIFILFDEENYSIYKKYLKGIQE
ncbi:MAG TPA: O-acetyl-ADP-ribose deacetylase [Spirochaetota bacterium]|nr:O-acetyl-ADP-ribose deacetylase [Spirochaetota bacterium]